jgi:6-pyruvoyltetrahydropterin/6-carboxytetrahydropterin synthase
LTPDANVELYGKCNNPYGHGHDYVLRVCVEGDIDPVSGRVISPGKLDRYIEECVVRVFDHRNMNLDVPDFQGVPTTENLALEIERRLRGAWSATFGGVRLDRIWLQETPRNTFELRTR